MFFGYPMKKISRVGFQDAVSGEMVNFYRCRNGKVWMANSRWSLFRIECTEEPAIDAAIEEGKKNG